MRLARWMTGLMVGAVMWRCTSGREQVPSSSQITTAQGALHPDTPLPHGAIVKRSRDWVTSYPPGRWRLAHPKALVPAVLWVSHILIRHRDVTPSIVAFKVPFWFVAPPIPSRTRDEALALARGIAKDLQARPERFPEVAFQLSEDVVTRDFGGSLGGISAGQFVRTPQVLDALAAIRPGEVSDVVETHYGFHILSRQSPPSDETVSGAHLVLGYDDAPWLPTYLARRNIPARTRAEALELADQLHARMLEAPDGFDDLVEQYSEHVDAMRAGDIGSWSTREQTPLPREVEILRQLPVGGVSAPFDSLFGIQILRRTANRPRTAYAMQSIELPFDSAQALGGPAFPESVFAKGVRLAASLAREPSRFDELREQYGKFDPEPWFAGRMDAPVERAIEFLPLGAIAARPVRLDSRSSVLLIRRVEPTELDGSERVAQFDLPAPDEPDIDYLVSDGLKPVDLGRLLSELGREAMALAKETAGAASLDRAHALARQRIEADASSEDRQGAFRELMQQVGDALGPLAFERYRLALKGTLERFVLAGAESSSARR